MTLRALAGLTLFCLGAAAAWAGPFDDFVLNGDAALVESGEVLRVVPTGSYNAGSAFIGSPVALSAGTSFSAAFSFRIQGGSAADGLVFVVQNAAAGANALGSEGGYIGYQGLAPSLGVVFDTWDNGFAADPGGDNISIVTGGDLTASTGAQVALGASDPPLRNGTRFAWIDYAAASGTLSVYYSDQSTRPDAPIVEGSGYDLAGMLGSQMYVGFTAATGGADDNHDVLSWQFETVTAVPEPQTYATFGAGLALLGMLAASRRRVSGRSGQA